MFQFPACPLLYSSDGSLHPPGCPIRKPVDQGLLAAPYGISSLGTSFVGTLPQGIHQRPCVALNTLPLTTNASAKTRRHRAAHPASPISKRKTPSPDKTSEEAIPRESTFPQTRKRNQDELPDTTALADARYTYKLALHTSDTTHTNPQCDKHTSQTTNSHSASTLRRHKTRPLPSLHNAVQKDRTSCTP